MANDSPHENRAASETSTPPGWLQAILNSLPQSATSRAIEGFCGAAIASAALGAPFNLAACLIPALVVFAGYTFDRLSGIREEGDRINQPERQQYFQRHWRLNLAAAWASLGAAALLCVQRSLFLSLFLIALPVVLTGLYSLGWKRFFPKMKYARIKDITLAKTATVDLAWGVMLVLIPALYLGLPLNFGLLLVYIHFSWRNAINSTLYDITDIEGDRINGTRTLAVVWGAQKTLRALFIANTLSLGWVMLLVGIPWAAKMALYIGVLYGFVYLYLFQRVRNLRPLTLAVNVHYLVTYLTFLLVCNLA